MHKLWKTMLQAHGPLAALLRQAANGNEHIAMHAAFKAAEQAKVLPKILPMNQVELAIGLAGLWSLPARLEELLRLSSTPGNQAQTQLAAAQASLQKILPHCARAQHVLLAQKHDVPVDRVSAVAKMLAGTGYELDDVLWQSKRFVPDWFWSGFKILNFARSAQAVAGWEGAHPHSDWVDLKNSFPASMPQLKSTRNPVLREVEDVFSGKAVGLERTLFMTERRLLLTQPQLAPNLSQIHQQLLQNYIDGRPPQVAEIQVKLQDGRLLHLAAYLDANQQLQVVEKLRTERNAPYQGGFPLLRSETGALLYPAVVNAQHSPAPLIHRGKLQDLKTPQLVPLEGLISSIQYQIFPASASDQRVQQASSYTGVVQAVSKLALPQARVWAVDDSGAPIRFELRYRNGQLLSFPPLTPTQQARLKQLHFVLEVGGAPLGELPARMPLNLKPVNTTALEIVAQAQWDYVASADFQAGRGRRINVVARTANNEPHQHFQLQFWPAPRTQGPGYEAEPVVEVLDGDGRRLEDTGTGLRLPVPGRADGVNLNTQRYSQLTVETYSVDARGAPEAALYRPLDTPEMRVAGAQGQLTAQSDTQQIQALLKSALRETTRSGEDRVNSPWSWFEPDNMTVGAVQNELGRKPLSELFILKSDYGLRGLKERLLKFYRLWRETAYSNSASTAWVAHVGLRGRGTSEDLLFQVRASEVLNERGQFIEHLEFLDMEGRLLDIDHAGQPCVWSAESGKPVSLDVQFDSSTAVAYLSKQALPSRRLSDMEVAQRVPGWQRGLDLDASFNYWFQPVVAGKVIQFYDNNNLEFFTECITWAEPEHLSSLGTSLPNMMITVAATNEANEVFDFRIRLRPNGTDSIGYRKFKIEYLSMDNRPLPIISIRRVKNQVIQSRAPASRTMLFTPETVFKEIWVRFDREAE